jgi:hypothetical protein
MPLERMAFPCWRCEQSAAAEARHWLANCDDSDLESKLSPGGNPMSCCRVRVVGVVPASDTTRAAT